MKPKIIGILGGTFDPIHYGHCRIAMECMQAFNMDHIRFVPCKNPVHRVEPEALAEHRLQMVKLATVNEPKFIVDDIEFRLGGPSYMHTTLINLRETFPENTYFCLILGMDAFSQLHNWFRWHELLDLTHIVIASRPNMPPPSNQEVLETMNQRMIRKPDELTSQRTGLFANLPVTRLDISARNIRSQISRGLGAKYLCPDIVLDYIDEKGLYRI